MQSLMMRENKDDQEDLSSVLANALKYKSIPGVSGEDLTANLNFDDEAFVESLSSATNTMRGVDVRNASLCGLFRGVLLGM